MGVVRAMAEREMEGRGAELERAGVAVTVGVAVAVAVGVGGSLNALVNLWEIDVRNRVRWCFPNGGLHIERQTVILESIREVKDVL